MFIYSNLLDLVTACVLTKNEVQIPKARSVDASLSLFQALRTVLAVASSSVGYDPVRSARTSQRALQDPVFHHVIHFAAWIAV